MTAAAALELLELIASTGARPWVDGGWGVDALLGHQTRAHADLDVAVAVDSVDGVRLALEDAGFRVIRDWLPAALALEHADGREVDVHPLTPTPDGGGDQDLSPDPHFHHPPPVSGMIGDRPVLCMDARTQLAAHRGYLPTPKDRADVGALATRFGLEPPPGYRPASA